MSEDATILIIDDEPVNVRLLEASFVKEGFRALKAKNGPEGRAIAQKEQPDLILLDIMMPGENGFVTCSRLKAHPKTTGIPVIFLSAVGDLAHKVEGLAMGAVDYITKPFEKAEVLARARLHIKLNRAYRYIINEQQEKLRHLQVAQQSILVRPEDLPEGSFAVFYKSLHEAGGDFYDVIKISDGIYGYFAADISGHDLGSSFITAALKVLIRQNSGPFFTPLDTVQMINSVLAPILAEGQHLTAAYVHINRLRSRITLISAGHPAILYLHLDGDAEYLDVEGDILGVFESVYLESKELPVAKGDRIFIYTDGLIEGFGEERKQRDEGKEDLRAACCATRHLPLNEAVHEMVTMIIPDLTATYDDLLLLGVEI